jgi:hypothetical protein
MSSADLLRPQSRGGEPMDTDFEDLATALTRLDSDPPPPPPSARPGTPASTPSPPSEGSGMRPQAI